MFLDLFAERLSEQEQQQFEEHVDGCAACHELMVGLARKETNVATTASPSTLLSPGVGRPSTPEERRIGLAPDAVFHGKYRVVELIGYGGMGEVYEVVHSATRRRCALKVLKAAVDSEWVKKRFEQEAYVTADVRSDHIVQIFDAGWDDELGMPFLVMELLEGQDLQAMLQREGGLAPELVIEILRQVALALDKTHAAGIVHRDLKPGNLFVTDADDGSPRVKILDFGIARIVRESSGPATSTKSIGTPMYMSPEQVLGEVSLGPSADRYALAHIAFCLLVGWPYFTVEHHKAGSPYDFMSRVIEGVTEAPSARAATGGVALPNGFDAWFERASNSDAELRFAGASEMVAALAEVFDQPLSASKIDLVAATKSGALPPADAPMRQVDAEPEPSTEASSALSQPAPSTMGGSSHRWLAAIAAIATMAAVVAFFVEANSSPDGGPASASTLGGEPITVGAPTSSQLSASPPAAVSVPKAGPHVSARPAAAPPVAAKPIAPRPASTRTGASTATQSSPKTAAASSASATKSSPAKIDPLRSRWGAQ